MIEDCTHEKGDFIKILSWEGGPEVYMCECGVLYDLQDDRNYDVVTHIMNGPELTELVRQVIMAQLDDVVSKIRYVK